jgi:hypothetical protein
MNGTEALAATVGGTDQDLTADQVYGLKFIKRLRPLLERLHGVGTERDKSGNRELFYDHYVLLVVFYMLNPLIRSMRGLQRTLGLDKVAKAIGIKRFSLGSFSEAPAIFEPKRLLEVIGELSAEARQMIARQGPRSVAQLELKNAITLVDGSILNALPSLARAAGYDTRYLRSRDGRDHHGWRLHTQIEILRLPDPDDLRANVVPVRIDVTGANKAGENSEIAVLGRTLQGDRTYVMDGGYADHDLFDQIVQAGSDYVCRIREDSIFEVLKEREVSAVAREAGVLRDALIQPRPGKGGKHRHPVRIIEVRVPPRRVRSRKAPGVHKSGYRISDRLMIATNLMDLSAELVALIYQCRYTVETFFRIFKSLLGMRHLLSQRADGVEIQTYCAVIATLLVSLTSGRKPDRATVEIVGFYMMGVASEQEVIAHLNRPDNRGVKTRAKDELREKLLGV